MSVGVRKRFHISLIVFLSVSAPRLTVPSLEDLEKEGDAALQAFPSQVGPSCKSCTIAVRHYSTG